MAATSLVVDASTGMAGNRTVHQKVLPSPGRLSTPTRPPMSSTRLPVMARPSPAPPRGSPGGVQRRAVPRGGGVGRQQVERLLPGGGLVEGLVGQGEHAGL